MIIRKYSSDDCAVLAELFYNTVHCVNARDYTAEQLDAWADGNPDLTAWDRSFLSHTTLIAEHDGIVVGFGDMDENGYLDRLYVHHEYQRQGVATAICDELELSCPVKNFVTHASITTKSFFANRGYKTIRRQEVERKGVLLTNFVMEK